MILPPWLPLFLALPVLLLGEELVRRLAFLHRFNIPAPVVGGLVISLGVLLANLCTPGEIRFTTSVSAPWWTWLVTISRSGSARPRRA